MQYFINKLWLKKDKYYKKSYKVNKYSWSNFVILKLFTNQSNNFRIQLKDDLLS